jgi:dTDP-4-dehydrorhamnose reductase
MDIVDLDEVISVVKEVKPDLIINSSAYTDVDRCHESIDLAYKINAIGARNLAVIALENNARLVHVSTDFVFDGYKS